jgi:hypothetical protein
MHTPSIARILHVCVFVMMLPLLAAPLRAQEHRDTPVVPARAPWHVGIAAGVFLGMHSGGFSFPDDCADCGRYGDATGIGTALDLRVGIPLARWLRLESRISAECHRGTFTSDPIESVIIGSGMQPQSLQLEDELVYTLRIVGLDLLAAVPLGRSGLTVLAGPTIGFRITETATVTERILSPQGAVFADGSSAHTPFDGDTEIARGMHAGIRAGLGYMIPVGRDIALGAEATWRLPLQPVTETDDWQTSGLRTTLAVLFLF